MTHYRVTKSPFRQFLLGLAGIILVLAAMDILWFHKVSSEPLEDDAGNITTRGEAWRRTDLIWGSLFLIAGTGLFAGGAIGLASGMPVVELSESGVRLRIAGPQKTVTVHWDQLLAARSTLSQGDGPRPRPVLVLDVRDPTRYPYDLWNAEWIDGSLHVDADGWSDPPDEVAVRLELELERLARLRAADESEDVTGDG